MTRIAIIFGVLITLPATLSQTAPCTTVNDMHLYVFPGDCSKFYQCAPGGDRVEKQCPIPLNFNVDIQVCDWYFKVDCTEANAGAMEEIAATGETATAAGTTTMVTSAPTKPEPTTAPATSIVAQTTAPTTTSMERALGCPSGIQFGTIAACDDPTGLQYVVCDAGVAIPFECTDGMVYNQLIQRCSPPAQLHACMPVT